MKKGLFTVVALFAFAIIGCGMKEYKQELKNNPALTETGGWQAVAKEKAEREKAYRAKEVAQKKEREAALSLYKQKVSLHMQKVSQIIADNEKTPSGEINGKWIVVDNPIAYKEIVRVENCDAMRIPMTKFVKKNSEYYEETHYNYCSCRLTTGAIARGLSELAGEVLIRYTAHPSYLSGDEQCPSGSLVYLKRNDFLNSTSSYSKYVKENAEREAKLKRKNYLVRRFEAEKYNPYP